MGRFAFECVILSKKCHKMASY